MEALFGDVEKMKKNIFTHIGSKSQKEDIEMLVKTDSIVLERIVSKGHASPAGFWYDQDNNEWVCLIKGCAQIEFANNEKIDLKAGDYLNIAAHEKHRVNWTDPSIETIWLALYY